MRRRTRGWVWKGTRYNCYAKGGSTVASCHSVWCIFGLANVVFFKSNTADFVASVSTRPTTISNHMRDDVFVSIAVKVTTCYSDNLW